MNIQKTVTGTTLTVELEGRLDTTTAPKLEEELRGSIDGLTCLVIDFEKLDYISSAGLRVLLAMQKITKARLISEELMTSLIGHADAGAAYMLLNVCKWLGEIIVEVSVPGTAYDFAGSLEMGVPLDAEEIGRDAEITIRNMILRSFAADLKYRNQANVNSVRLTVVRSKARMGASARPSSAGVGRSSIR